MHCLREWISRNLHLMPTQSHRMDLLDTLHGRGPTIYSFPPYPSPFSPFCSTSSEQFTSRPRNPTAQHLALQVLRSPGPGGAAYIARWAAVTKQHQRMKGIDYTEYKRYHLPSLRQTWDRIHPQHLGVFCKQIHNSKRKKANFAG